MTTIDELFILKMILLGFLPVFVGAADMSHDDRLMHPAKITVELMNPSQWNKNLLRICCIAINDFENTEALMQKLSSVRCRRHIPEYFLT